MMGTCTFWQNQRGYGFITAPDGTQYFLHISNFERGKTPVRGALISYVLGEPLHAGTKLQAINAKFATAEEIKQAQIHAGAGALASGAGV